MPLTELDSTSSPHHVESRAVSDEQIVQARDLILAKLLHYRSLHAHLQHVVARASPSDTGHLADGDLHQVGSSLETSATIALWCCRRKGAVCSKHAVACS